MKTFSERLTQLIHNRGVSQKEISDKTEISPSALANYKKDRTPKSEELYRLAQFFEVSMEWLITGVNTHLDNTNVDIEFSNLEKPTRRIPLVGWAHAGNAVNYEDHPDRWDNLVCTDCRDESAFAVELEGDSMAPYYNPGDILVLTPSEQAYSGRLVVVRFKDFGEAKDQAGGVLFRRLEYEGENVILKPLNESYPVKEYHRSEFEWIYPVWGRWTQLHK